MGCEVRETQSSNGSRRPARSGRGLATTNHLERNRPLARHSGAAEEKNKKIEGAMSHSDAFLDESVSLSSFSLNVFPKGMFRVETIVRIVFAAI